MKILIITLKTFYKILAYLEILDFLVIVYLTMLVIVFTAKCNSPIMSYRDT